MKLLSQTLNLLLYLQVTYAYSYYTHNFLGSTTETLLQKDILSKIKTEFGEINMGEMSVWADKVKRTKEYSWTRQLHYIDILECTTKETSIPDLINKYCEDSKCIPNTILNLRNNSLNFKNLTREEKFKFLLHFSQE
jgi:hypothetical protein